MTGKSNLSCKVAHVAVLGRLPQSFASILDQVATRQGAGGRARMLAPEWVSKAPVWWHWGSVGRSAGEQRSNLTRCAPDSC
jgi:hypothetical protein